MTAKKTKLNNIELTKKYINILLFIFVIAQPLMWLKTNSHLPNLAIISDLPNKKLINVYSLGDQQMYFRYLSLDLQNSGDSFGRFTALKNYDYALLEQWLFLINGLDTKSKYLPSIAAYYYSNTQNIPDNIHVVNFLDAYYDQDPAENWWWLAQATIIATHKLKDKELAIRLAQKLSATNAKMPRWAQQMHAIILAEHGEKKLALTIIKDLAERHDDYTQSEINFMNYFIKDRLGYLKDGIKKAPSRPEDGRLG